MEDIWLWEMEMCCEMQIKALRKKMGAYQEKNIAPGTIIDSEIQACPNDETLFEGIDFHINVQEKGLLEAVGQVFYWHPMDGGWHKTVTLKTFDSLESCKQWLQDENHASSEDCARILKTHGR